MRLWIDDIRPAPEGYIWCHSVYRAMKEIHIAEHGIEDAFGFIKDPESIELIDMDHDAGDYAQYGGDYICLLNWLEETGRNYPIRIHSANPVGQENMRRIIQRNNWEEIK